MSAAGFLPAFVVRLDHSKLGFDSSPSKFLDVDLILKESPGYSAWTGPGSELCWIPSFVQITQLCDLGQLKLSRL